MFATKVLRQAAQHAERTPSIKFLGKRTIPGTFVFSWAIDCCRTACADRMSAASVDHTPQPHPASPTHSLPSSFTQSSHTSFSSYRDHAQQFGPLRKTITAANAGIGGQAGSNLGPVAPPKGTFFDRNELPPRFHRSPLSLAEIEAIETGGAAAFA